MLVIYDVLYRREFTLCRQLKYRSVYEDTLLSLSDNPNIILATKVNNGRFLA